MTNVNRSLSQRPATGFSDRDGLGFVGGRTSPIGARAGGVYLLLSLVGVAGFIGLLLAAHFLPAQAETLRVAALAWFLGFGLARMAVRPGRRRR